EVVRGGYRLASRQARHGSYRRCDPILVSRSTAGDAAGDARDRSESSTAVELHRQRLRPCPRREKRDGVKDESGHDSVSAAHAVADHTYLLIVVGVNR